MHRFFPSSPIAATSVLIVLLVAPSVGCGQGTLPVPETPESLSPTTLEEADGANAQAEPSAAEARPETTAPGATSAAVLPPELEGQLGWLGVSLLSTTQETAEALGYAQPLIEVDIVFVGSPAETSEFQTGDLIVSVDDEPVFKIQDLVDRVKATPPGTKVIFKRIRGGKEQEVPVLLGVRPEMYGLLREHFVDQKAPDFQVTDVKTGAAITLSELRGKVVPIDYWATWCGPCRRSMPHLAALYEEHAEAGFVLVGISDEEAAEINTFLAETPMPYAIGLDPDRVAHRAYMVNALPTLFLVGRDGVVLSVFIGSDEIDTVKAAVKAALAQPG